MFRNEIRGFHHGQSDNTLIAYSPPGTAVGYIEYSIYQGEVAIQYIFVKEDKRRMGFGRALLLELQRQNPDTEISLGMSTKDGTAMLDSMKSKYFTNQEYEKLKKEELELKNRIEILNKKRDSWLQLPEKEKELTRAKVLSDGEEWNRINDRLWEIEKELLYMKPGKKIFET